MDITTVKQKPDTDSYRVAPGLLNAGKLGGAKSTALFLDQNGKITQKASSKNNVSGTQRTI